jgi:hypothetical protein
VIASEAIVRARNFVLLRCSRHNRTCSDYDAALLGISTASAEKLTIDLPVIPGSDSASLLANDKKRPEGRSA